MIRRRSCTGGSCATCLRHSPLLTTPRAWLVHATAQAGAQQRVCGSGSQRRPRISAAVRGGTFDASAARRRRAALSYRVRHLQCRWWCVQGATLAGPSTHGGSLGRLCGAPSGDFSGISRQDITCGATHEHYNRKRMTCSFSRLLSGVKSITGGRDPSFERIVSGTGTKTPRT